MSEQVGVNKKKMQIPYTVGLNFLSVVYNCRPGFNRANELISADLMKFPRDV